MKEKPKTNFLGTYRSIFALVAYKRKAFGKQIYLFLMTPFQIYSNKKKITVAARIEFKELPDEDE